MTPKGFYLLKSNESETRMGTANCTLSTHAINWAAIKLSSEQYKIL